jgi:signal transduction histidine kinase
MGRFLSAPFDESALKLALTGKRLVTNTEYEGEPVRVLSAPAIDHGQMIGVVQVAHELTTVRDLWRRQIQTLLLFVPIALVVAGIGAAMITNRALQPVGAMTETAAKISETDLSKRLPVVGDDEMGRLARTFNAMLARIETSFRDLKSAYDKLERSYEIQRRFTADASHELRTPLARIRLAASSAIGDHATAQDMREALEVADHSAKDMSKLVNELLTLSKADAGQLGLTLSALDLRVIASDALERAPAPNGLSVETRFDLSEVKIFGDEGHLVRVVTNLLTNAYRHTDPGGTINLEIGSSQGEGFVAVADNGEGIAREHLGRIFDRFYRVSSSRTAGDGGAGLGLAICKSIIEAHGGTIEIQSALGKGTKAVVRIPLVP